jgi:hypothetical protein
LIFEKEQHMSESNDEVKKLLHELIASTNKTLSSHKIALDRHEADVMAAFKTAKTHTAAIEHIQANLEKLAPLINAQSTLITALQGTMLRVVARLGMDSEAPPSLSN